MLGGLGDMNEQIEEAALDGWDEAAGMEGWADDLAKTVGALTQGAKDIITAKQKPPAQQVQNPGVNYTPPADNTMLYIGIGVAVLGVGYLVYRSTKKKS